MYKTQVGWKQYEPENWEKDVCTFYYLNNSHSIGKNDCCEQWSLSKAYLKLSANRLFLLYDTVKDIGREI
jgi:hypothetical protein